MRPENYCNSLTEYSRYKTRVVKIGDVLLGCDHPIRLQSMTTTDTMDTKATVEQSVRMIEAGCELVRITAPSLKEAQNLENIKKNYVTGDTMLLSLRIFILHLMLRNWRRVS
jgi:(E)-4-hydroxy-3-methylbut-2-enyl-diphosphate synthase